MQEFDILKGDHEREGVRLTSGRISHNGNMRPLAILYQGEAAQ